MAAKLVLREFTCDNLIGDYLLLKIAVAELEEYHFKDMTPQQLEREKRDLIQELKLDTVFKLLTKLEADIRQDYNTTIKKYQTTDGLSKEYLQLCEEFRRRTGEYNQPIASICKKVRLDDILDTSRLYFKNLDRNFAKNCSVLTGYFTHIRHRYAHGRYFKRYHPTVIPDPEALGIIYHQFETLVFARTK